jgi:hypothetical protein
LIISLGSAPALGDVRLAKRGDVIVIIEGATARKDWGRYLDAISAAITRGATVGTREVPE